jgi:hypothetical protein
VSVEKIYSDDEIEVLGTTDIMILISNKNSSCGATQAIPVIRTQSAKVESLPIRAELNPTAKTSKGKCIIID